MTRKDYQVIADALATTWAFAGPTGRKTVELVARDLADALAARNPRFKRERFLNACQGVEIR